MPLTEYYRSEGSGSLQFRAANSTYTIDKLARMMITESDNSATNMLMARLGSMTDINSALREWGLKHTYVQTWLPDLGGTNHSTARDMAQILYNIDNPKFLSNSSREKSLIIWGMFTTIVLLRLDYLPVLLSCTKPAILVKCWVMLGLFMHQTGKNI